jgi:hypothetical protein
MKFSERQSYTLYETLLMVRHTFSKRPYEDFLYGGFGSHRMLEIVFSKKSFHLLSCLVSC